MNGIDSLEDVYFGKSSRRKRSCQTQRLIPILLRYKAAAPPSIHVPYNLMAFLVKMAPKECINDYVAEKLQSYGYLQKNQALDDGLLKRMEYALNWTQDFEEIKETAVELTVEEKKALTELVTKLQTEDDPDKIQNAIFNSAKANGQNQVPSSKCSTRY